MNHEHRLNRLERTLRRQRLAIMALAAGLATTLLMGMQDIPVTELSLRKLTIVDEVGRPRLVAEGGTKEPGVATLAHLDEQGIPRIFAGTFPGGVASVTVADRLGQGRLVAGTYPGGSASLVCASSDESIRLAAGTRADGSAQLTLYNAERKVSWERTSPGAPAEAP
ncbi:MAG: hypothetical protein MK116_08570 [Phycisphaerales bacterium]|nr:hypothetical protein [Phycisphaerales bacterium]